MTRVRITASLFLLLTASPLLSQNRTASRAESGEAQPSDVLQQGREAIDRQDWISAERRFRQYLRVDKTGTRRDSTLYYLAWALKEQHEWADADLVLQRLLAEHPRSSWAEDARAMRMELAAHLVDSRTLRDGVHSNDEHVQAAALQSLLAKNPDAGLKEIGNLFTPESKAGPYLKSIAISLLGLSPDQRCSETLLSIVQTSEDERLRMAAVGALGQRKDPVAAQALDRLVMEDSGKLGAAAFISTKATAPQKLETLVEISRKAASIYVRGLALLLMGAQKEEPALAEIERAYSSIPDDKLRLFALDAMWRDGSSRAISLLGMAAKTDSSPSLRAAAAFYLAPRGTPQSADALVRWYNADADEEVKVTVLALLGRCGDPVAEAKLDELDMAELPPALKDQVRAILRFGNIRVPLPFGGERLPGISPAPKRQEP
jgi:HEAT repeats